MAESPAPPPDLPIGQEYPARRRADPLMLSRGFDAAADVVLSLLKHTNQMESADLTVAGGDTVRIVCLSEVETWLTECAAVIRTGRVL